MVPRPAADSRAVLVRWMNITDANAAGMVHGGTVMKLCDEAAGLAAIKHSRRRVVTAGMDRMTFLDAVQIGELLTFKAAVNAVWRTSRWRSACGWRRSARTRVSCGTRTPRT